MRILENKGFDDWLEQRKGWVTATDLAKIKGGTEAQFHKLWLEKRSGSKFGGNKYTSWGKEREPVIAARVAAWVEADRNITLERNDCLCVVDDLGLAATPDMMESGTDEPVMIGEIKTWLGEWESWEHFFRKKDEYVQQVQAQLIVTGADMCVFAVETYREDSADMIPGEIHYTYIEPDLIAQENIKELVRRFYEYTPPETEHGDDKAKDIADDLFFIEAQIEEIKSEMKPLEAELKTLTQARAEVWQRAFAIYGSDHRFVEVGDQIMEIKPGRVTSRFDRRAFEKEQPELAEKYVNQSVGAPSISLMEKED